MPLSGGHDVLYIMFPNAFYALALVMETLILAHAYYCHVGCTCQRHRNTLTLGHTDLYQKTKLFGITDRLGTLEEHEFHWILLNSAGAQSMMKASGLQSV